MSKDDEEDDEWFIWGCSNPLFTDHYRAVQYGVGIWQWRMDRGKPTYFSYQKGSVSYDQDPIPGPLWDRLTQVGNKAIKRFWKGAQI